eukprot:CAMPEP_0181224858 /NCGR_PEP_ID=MMETSP1096-20121128/31366_1 /TAXON_ID=156174 ORGANISM="Chrysochromulina ericina, Strain CCMP281" /NCGR_SAMPLE_ID=MMETSP1096 /ASSEMBLY_ACC=CAM_ASM_000453 /LENGTH=78 /DNA_ID=CAMNT_0023317999 /DNA_START=304 /DNA_END=537 /DNA_ORIENTATION=-
MAVLPGHARATSCQRPSTLGATFDMARSSLRSSLSFHAPASAPDGEAAAEAARFDRAPCCRPGSCLRLDPAVVVDPPS